jgi:hypothetical protein
MEKVSLLVEAYQRFRHYAHLVSCVLNEHSYLIDNLT